METGLVGSMLSGVQTSMTANISDALPIAGVIFGTIAGIGIAIKLFKRITGARA